MTTSKNVRISVLITDYNTPPENLIGAVRSILNQNFIDFEIVIVDDGSERPTQSVLENINDQRVRVIRHQTNRGTASALNTAVEAAVGEYLLKIDSDDWVVPSYMSHLYNAIEEAPEYTVVSCRARQFRDDGSLGAVVGRVGEKRKENILRRDAPIHGASIMRRADILAVGGYPPYRRGQDFALWCELLLDDKRLKVIEPILYYYRVNTSDYGKRTLRRRKDSLQASIYYYPKLGATIWEYRYILKSIVAGLLPPRLLRVISEKRLRSNHSQLP